MSSDPSSDLSSGSSPSSTAGQDFGSIFAAPALAALARHTPIPPSVHSMMQASAIRLLDSAMVIEDSHAPFAQVAESKVQTALPHFPVLHAVKELVGQIGEQGFGPHAVNFFGMLGAVMTGMAGTEKQISDIHAWVDAGMTGCFCMTDPGGPLASQWQSSISTSAPLQMKVNKIWAMNASKADFAIVVLRRGNSMILTPCLVPPEVFRTMARKESGQPFLDDHLMLGNVSFEVEAQADWLLAKGGPISPKIFLTIARPWLIQALCAHVDWLAGKGRVKLDAASTERIAFLRSAAVNQAALGMFDRFSEDQAMALKWIANETWLQMVTSGAVPAMNDQRDLLSFTKMEGSSYRCFLEIYERNKRMRLAHA